MRLGEATPVSERRTQSRTTRTEVRCPGVRLHPLPSKKLPHKVFLSCIDFVFPASTAFTGWDVGASNIPFILAGLALAQPPVMVILSAIGITKHADIIGLES